jgi:hypothetical protein
MEFVLLLELIASLSKDQVFFKFLELASSAFAKYSFLLVRIKEL